MEEIRKKMNIISPFNSDTLDAEQVEEAERSAQDLRIMILTLTAEARVAARSLGDNAAVERIAAIEKQTKADLKLIAELLSELAQIAECYDNRGINRMRPETLRDRASYLLDLALKRSGTGPLAPFTERRKA
jgi:hypothetical protein